MIQRRVQAGRRRAKVIAAYAKWGWVGGWISGLIGVAMLFGFMYLENFWFRVGAVAGGQVGVWCVVMVLAGERGRRGRGSDEWAWEEGRIRSGECSWAELMELVYHPDNRVRALAQSSAGNWRGPLSPVEALEAEFWAAHEDRRSLEKFVASVAA